MRVAARGFPRTRSTQQMSRVLQVFHVQETPLLLTADSLDGWAADDTRGTRLVDRLFELWRSLQEAKL